MRKACLYEPLLRKVCGEHKEAEVLIEGLEATALLADREYDSNKIIQKAVEKGIKPAISPKKIATFS
jgi:hypothetical protein